MSRFILIEIILHRYGREFADPYTMGHGVGPVPGGYGVSRKKMQQMKGEKRVKNTGALIVPNYT